MWSKCSKKRNKKSMESKKVLEGLGLNIVTAKEATKGRVDIAANKPPELNKPKLITRGDFEAAVKAELIPNAYIDCEFNIDKVKENTLIQARVSARRFYVQRFDDYKDITLNILSTILAHKVPEQSYIIGAPNGFGKTSFVNTCLINLFAQGKKCVPYVSLSELARIKMADEKELISGLSPERHYKGKDVRSDEEYMNALYDSMDSQVYEKRPINLVGKYSWSEYMNSEVLFCYFTDISSKLLESEMLRAILNIRGAKGLPTIVMISTSLDPYKKDKILAEYVWNEILAYKEQTSYDRVTHISCYKDYNTAMKMGG